MHKLFAVAPLLGSCAVLAHAGVHTILPVATIAVPEPASIVLLVLMIAAVAGVVKLVKTRSAKPTKVR
jgi:hypothetical protein